MINKSVFIVSIEKQNTPRRSHCNVYKQVETVENKMTVAYLLYVQLSLLCVFKARFQILLLFVAVVLEKRSRKKKL